MNDHEIGVPGAINYPARPRPLPVGLKWEQIDAMHQRAPVPGGWLVKAYEHAMTVLPDQGMQQGYEWRMSMAFVPDALHAWKIGGTA